jgi:hypothetical protein
MTEQLFIARVINKAGRVFYVSPAYGSREAAATDAFQACWRARECTTTLAAVAPIAGLGRAGRGDLASSGSAFTLRDVIA